MKLTEEQRSRLQSMANRFSEGEGIIVRIMAEIGDIQAGDEDYLAVCRLGDGRNEARNAAFTLNMVLNGSADIPSTQPDALSSFQEVANECSRISDILTEVTEAVFANSQADEVNEFVLCIASSYADQMLAMANTLQVFIGILTRLRKALSTDGGAVEK